MTEPQFYEVIIIGGSYAGLSAAMALGRSRRRVLIIDDHKPCNRQTPHSHNFITQDGQTPAAIAAAARQQVSNYPTISWLDTRATGAERVAEGIAIHTEASATVTAKKLLLATGVKDIALAVPGFEACWGISALHCPYCHGYEVRDEVLGIIAAGDMAFEYAKLIHHWSRRLTLFTNGAAGLLPEQMESLQAHGIAVVADEIAEMVHQDGYVQHLLMKDGTRHELKAVFGRGGIVLRDGIAASLGCALVTEGMAMGLIQADDMGKTSQPDIFAAGDNSNPMRSVAVAVAAGNKAGAFINRELIQEAF